MKHHVFSSTLIKNSSISIEYCFDDEDGNCQEFATLAEAKREAKQYSKDHPDFEVNVYAIGSTITYMNGKEINY